MRKRQGEIAEMERKRGRSERERQEEIAEREREDSICSVIFNSFVGSGGRFGREAILYRDPFQLLDFHYRPGSFRRDLVLSVISVYYMT